MRRISEVWHVAREYSGIAEAGGVKDVVRGLAEALARTGAAATVVLPLYGFLSPSFRKDAPVASFSLAMPDHENGNTMVEESVKVFACPLKGVRLMLVDSKRFASKRNVYTYTAEDEAENHWRKRGTGHWDFHQMNLILQKAALETALVLGESPAVMHCHDGHTSFLPAIMRGEGRYKAHFRNTAVVVTIHNAGPGYHQEVWQKDFARLLTGLEDSILEKGMIGATVDPLLLAGSYAALSTVSEQYGRELLSERDNEISGGLGRALRERGIALSGITNGVDPEPWDPRYPEKTGLPCGFDPQSGNLEGKRKCRSDLLAAIGASESGGERPLPLYGFIGRLTGQKGIDVLFGALRQLLQSDPCPLFVILGEGEKEKEDMIRWLASGPSAAGRLVFVPRYDVQLAKLIYAASDFFLVPSEYEPCGLTDYIAQLSGSIPLVHRVGGLVKVRDGETGFSYDEQSPAALSAAIQRTFRLYRADPALLERIRRTAFVEIYSRRTWDIVLGTGYMPLYEKAIAEEQWTRK